MSRVFSIVIVMSVGVLLASLVVACLWPQSPAATPPDDTGSEASMTEASGTAAGAGQPTVAPPRPASFNHLERGVVHATVEVEVAGPPDP